MHGSSGTLGPGVAEEGAERLAELLRLLADSYPDVSAYSSDLVTVTGNYAFMLKQAGRLADAEAAYLGGIGVLTKLVARYRKSPRCRADLANWYTNLAHLYQLAGRLPDAEREHLRALEVRERLAAYRAAQTAAVLAAPDPAV